MSGPYRRPAAKRPRALRHHRPDQGEHTVATSSRVSLTLTFKAKLYILIVILCAPLAALSAPAIHGPGRMAGAGQHPGRAIRRTPASHDAPHPAREPPGPVRGGGADTT